VTLLHHRKYVTKLTSQDFTFPPLLSTFPATSLKHIKIVYTGIYITKSNWAMTKAL